jgi:hypothetical protein
MSESGIFLIIFQGFKVCYFLIITTTILDPFPPHFHEPHSCARLAPELCYSLPLTMDIALALFHNTRGHAL